MMSVDIVVSLGERIVLLMFDLISPMSGGLSQRGMNMLQSSLPPLPSEIPSAAGLLS